MAGMIARFYAYLDQFGVEDTVQVSEIISPTANSSGQVWFFGSSQRFSELDLDKIVRDFFGSRYRAHFHSRAPFGNVDTIPRFGYSK